MFSRPLGTVRAVSFILLLVLAAVLGWLSWKWNIPDGAVSSDALTTRQIFTPRHLEQRRLQADSGDGGGPPRARIGYFLMARGAGDVGLLSRLLKEIYSPDNWYLIHLAYRPEGHSAAFRGKLDQLMAELTGHGDRDNIRLLHPAMTLSWGGFSVLLCAVYGMSTLLQWTQDWDYFINLSSADFPLLTQGEISEVLGTFAARNASFMMGRPLSWTITRHRVKEFADDQELYRPTQRDGPAFVPVGGRRAVDRPVPTAFLAYKGEFWVALHRAFVSYIVLSPDNIARSMMSYFASFPFADESYMPTLACHARVRELFPIHNDSLRHIVWTEGTAHPHTFTVDRVPELLESGAMFARKFSQVSPQQLAAIVSVQDELQDATKSAARIRRTLDRMLNGSDPGEWGPGRFCMPPSAQELKLLQ